MTMSRSRYDQAPQLSGVGWVVILGIALTVAYALIVATRPDPRPERTQTPGPTRSADAANHPFGRCRERCPRPSVVDRQAKPTQEVVMSDSGTLRIGPRMMAAYEYVKAHPGCTKYEASKAIGPHGSNFYGWRAVNRAIAANMIIAVKRGNKWVLVHATRPNGL